MPDLSSVWVRTWANLSNFFRSQVILGCVTSPILIVIIPTTNHPGNFFPSLSFYLTIFFLIPFYFLSFFSSLPMFLFWYNIKQKSCKNNIRHSSITFNWVHQWFIFVPFFFSLPLSLFLENLFIFYFINFFAKKI